MGQVANRVTSMPRAVVLALFGLLAADALFVLLHVLQISGTLSDPRLLLSWDHGYAELFGYAQAATATTLLFLVYRRRAEAVYLAWSLVLVAVIADDALIIHERVAHALAPRLPLPSRLGPSPQNITELVVLGAIGAALLVLIAWAHRRSGAQARADSRGLLLLLAVLGFFVVVVDRMHAALAGGAGDVAGILEDGGELIVLSLILAYAVNLLLRRGGQSQDAPAREGAAYHGTALE